MNKRVKVITAKSGNLSSIPGKPHSGKREPTPVCSIVSMTPVCVFYSLHTCAVVHTCHTNKYMKEKS